MDSLNGLEIPGNNWFRGFAVTCTIHRKVLRKLLSVDFMNLKCLKSFETCAKNKFDARLVKYLSFDLIFQKKKFEIYAKFLLFVGRFCLYG